MQQYFKTNSNKILLDGTFFKYSDLKEHSIYIYCCRVSLISSANNVQWFLIVGFYYDRKCSRVFKCSNKIFFKKQEKFYVLIILKKDTPLNKIENNSLAYYVRILKDICLYMTLKRAF